MSKKIIAIMAFALSTMFVNVSMAATPWQMNDRVSAFLEARSTSSVNLQEFLSQRSASAVEAAQSGQPRGASFLNTLAVFSIYGRTQNQPSQAFFSRSRLANYWYSVDTLEDPDDGENGRPEIPEVPIPAAVWLFGSALGLLAGWKRRRQATLKPTVSGLVA